jgi:fructose-1,6-bisphosphatase/sedoheptulose 1,7-bisphosphatase-like protein
MLHSGMSTTIRVSTVTRDTLHSLSKARGKSIQDVTEAAVELYRRRTLLEEANRAYAAVQEDSGAKQLWREELNAWDATSIDGLEPE